MLIDIIFIIIFNIIIKTKKAITNVILKLPKKLFIEYIF